MRAAPQNSIRAPIWERMAHRECLVWEESRQAAYGTNFRKKAFMVYDFGHRPNLAGLPST